MTRSKGRVEGAVLIVERGILALLRHQRFLSLNELNATIRQAVADLNSNARDLRGIW